MEWKTILIILVGLLIVGTIIGVIFRSVLTALAVSAILLLVGAGYGVTQLDWLKLKGLESSRGIGDSLSRLGCGENELIIGDPEACENYREALDKCERRTTASSEKRCVREAEAEFESQSS
jgi:hypothetical protein